MNRIIIENKRINDAPNLRLYVHRVLLRDLRMRVYALSMFRLALFLTQFWDVVSSIGCKVSFDHWWERFNQYFKRLSVINFMSFFSFSYVLKEGNNISGTVSTWEHKLIISSEFYDYIWHSEKCCPPWSRSDFNPFNFFVWNIEYIRWKPLPPHRNYRWFGHDPSIHIPIKSLIHQY